MRRYYISTVIGDGFSPLTSYRPKLADVPGVNYSCEIKTDPATGNPLLPWALCIVTGNRHGQIISDADNTPLPDVALDMKMSSMHTPTKTKFKNDCAKIGLPASFVDNTDGYRDAIRGIGRLLNPVFDENYFDVSE